MEVLLGPPVANPSRECAFMGILPTGVLEEPGGVAPGKCDAPAEWHLRVACDEFEDPDTGDLVRSCTVQTCGGHLSAARQVGDGVLAMHEYLHICGVPGTYFIWTEEMEAAGMKARPSFCGDYATLTRYGMASLG